MKKERKIVLFIFTKSVTQFIMKEKSHVYSEYFEIRKKTEISLQINNNKLSKNFYLSVTSSLHKKNFFPSKNKKNILSRLL